jgi:two-component system, OmpR family, KDP operon response regulator KdpE
MSDVVKGEAALRARAILVIEDDVPIRRAVKNALEDLTDRVVEAANGQAGIDLAAAERPELVILDLGLPDLPGVEVCREIRRWATMPILVLSARDGEAEKVQLLNVGADDYITKPFGVPEFVARVRALLRRSRSPKALTQAALQTSDGLTIDFARRVLSRDGETIRLTPLEWEILSALAKAAGRTLTHQQIFDAVWGRNFGNPQQYLRVHITNLRRKIEKDSSNPQVVMTEPGVGYRFGVPDSTG